MKNTEDDKNKQKWEQQLDEVKERLEHGDEPESIKDIYGASLEHKFNDVKPKTYARMDNGVIHSEQEHNEQGHSEDDCYDLKV